GGEVVLASGNDDPKGTVDAHVGPRRASVLLFGRQVDVAGKPRDGDPDAELLLEVLREPVNEVVRALIALMYQRIVHLDLLDRVITLIERCDIRVVEPDRVGGRPHVGFELPRICQVQVPHGGSQHGDIAGTLKEAENEAAWGRHNQFELWCGWSTLKPSKE